MWYLPAVTGRPQDGQYPSAVAVTGSTESVEHAEHIFAPGESSRDVVMAASPLLSAWRHLLARTLAYVRHGQGAIFSFCSGVS
jgi:hypothetical protein